MNDGFDGVVSPFGNSDLQKAAGPVGSDEDDQLVFIDGPDWVVESVDDVVVGYAVTLC